MVISIKIDWEKEVWLTITRAFEESHTVDIAILELNTLKMAMNITFGDLRSVVVPAILGLLNVNSNMSTIFQVFSTKRSLKGGFLSLNDLFIHMGIRYIRYI